MLAIKTENLTKKYKDKVAVNSINLSINKGEIYVKAKFTGCSA